MHHGSFARRVLSPRLLATYLVAIAGAALFWPTAAEAAGGYPGNRLVSGLHRSASVSAVVESRRVAAAHRADCVRRGPFHIFRASGGLARCAERSPQAPAETLVAAAEPDSIAVRAEPVEAAEAPAERASEPAVVTYTVQPGDTLWRIAERELGRGDLYPAIIEANSAVIAHPDQIRPGQVLTIPAAVDGKTTRIG